MLRKRKHPEFIIFLLIYILLIYILLIYVLLMSFMLPASYNPQVRTRG